MIKIKEYIKGKVVFLGMGNLIRGDDGAGCVFINRLKGLLKGTFPDTHFFDAGQVPENYVEVIARIKPDRIFIVDSVDFGARAGETRLFEKAEPYYNFFTHTLSLDFILDYLRGKTGAEIFIIGIQPEKIKWGAGLSPRVEKAVKELAIDVFESLKSKKWKKHNGGAQNFI